MKDLSGVRVYKAGRRSVNRALDHLRCARSSKTAGSRSDDEGSVQTIRGTRVTMHCCRTYSIGRKKKKGAAFLGFCRGLAASEMRKCLARRDWTHLIELFPLLLKGRLETEPLAWRYALAVLLYYPESSSETLCHFLSMCIGGQDKDVGHFLEQLLSLQNTLD